jgi:hypothetical protein
VVIFVGGCHFERSTQTALAPAQIDVTGRWATDLTVQGVTGRMTWTLTQTTGSVTGSALVSQPNGFVLLNGAVSGTLTGSSLAYTITVAPGAVPNQPSCSGRLAGTMTVVFGVVSTMTGPISLTSSTCSLQMPATPITLTKT